MRLRALALPLLLLAVLPGAAASREPTPPAKEIRVTSASPGRDAYFRVRVDPGAAPAGGTLQLLGASTVHREGDDVQVRTPATLRIVSDGPFRMTLASVPGEGDIQVVQHRGGREVTASGDALTLAREEHGGPVKLVSARGVRVRLPGRPASR